MTKATKRKGGRPPLGDANMTQLSIRLPQPIIEGIDKIRTGRLDCPERSTIIRELLAEALTKRNKR